MFAKLLKHEWRATRGVVSLLCVIILIAGITIGITAYTMISASQDGATVRIDGSVVASTMQSLSEFAEVIGVLLIMAGVAAIAVCGAASVFVVIYRFYKRCFTEEGYLTFTLPVNHHQILLSSILNSIFGVLLVILACFAAAAIAFSLFLIAFNYQIIWADVWAAWKDVWQQLSDSFRKNLDQFAILGFSTLFGALSELIVLMLSVTIGSLIAKKHKILAAVGVYYGIGMVESIVYSTLALRVTTDRELTHFLATPGILGIALTIGGYFLMHRLISKKLNLA